MDSLKDNQNDDSYTFVMDLDLSSNHDLQGPLNSKGSDENTGATDVDNLNKIYKKK